MVANPTSVRAVLRCDGVALEYRSYPRWRAQTGRGGEIYISECWCNMNDQNIYDNKTFFDGYKELRGNPASANIFVEKPALFSLCPSFAGKSVLDLGCGFGENCIEFSRLGAKSVVGIDISEKMLQVANNENKSENITFLQMSMSDLSGLNQKFDIALSSLAVHYIEDFNGLLQSVYRLLNNNGLFIFSQEHPLTTALKKENYWSYDDDDNIAHYNLTDYSMLGERKTSWIVDNVIKYHRSFSSIFNSLIEVGFIIEKVLEPMPPVEIMSQHPAYRRYYHKPDFLLIRTRK
jgi:SAM-dependent methyltransferase